VPYIYTSFNLLDYHSKELGLEVAVELTPIALLFAIVQPGTPVLLVGPQALIATLTISQPNPPIGKSYIISHGHLLNMINEPIERGTGRIPDESRVQKENINSDYCNTIQYLFVSISSEDFCCCEKCFKVRLYLSRFRFGPKIRDNTQIH